MEGLWDALVPGLALPLVVVAGGAGRVGGAEPLVTHVTAIIVGIAAPRLENAPLVVALELVGLAKAVSCEKKKKKRDNDPGVSNNKQDAEKTDLLKKKYI